MPDLSLISTDDLIFELCNRFEHMGFAGIQEGYTTDKQCLYRRKWKGNAATVAGLMFQVMQRATEDHFNEAEDYDDA